MGLTGDSLKVLAIHAAAGAMRGNAWGAAPVAQLQSGPAVRAEL